MDNDHASKKRIWGILWMHVQKTDLELLDDRARARVPDSVESGRLGTVPPSYIRLRAPPLSLRPLPGT